MRLMGEVGTNTVCFTDCSFMWPSFYVKKMELKEGSRKSQWN
jgi:hypothetical protein